MTPYEVTETIQEYMHCSGLDWADSVERLYSEGYLPKALYESKITCTPRLCSKFLDCLADENLKPIEKIVYAAILFSCQRDTWTTITNSAIAKTVGVTPATVVKATNGLQQKGYILKTNRGGHPNFIEVL